MSSASETSSLFVPQDPSSESQPKKRRRLFSRKNTTLSGPRDPETTSSNSDVPSDEPTHQLQLQQELQQTFEPQQSGRPPRPELHAPTSNPQSSTLLASKPPLLGFGLVQPRMARPRKARWHEREPDVSQLKLLRPSEYAAREGGADSALFSTIHSPDQLQSPSGSRSDVPAMASVSTKEPTLAPSKSGSSTGANKPQDSPEELAGSSDQQSATKQRESLPASSNKTQTAPNSARRLTSSDNDVAPRTYQVRTHRAHLTRPLLKSCLSRVARSPSRTLNGLTNDRKAGKFLPKIYLHPPKTDEIQLLSPSHTLSLRNPNLGGLSIQGQRLHKARPPSRSAHRKLPPILQCLRRANLEPHLKQRSLSKSRALSQKRHLQHVLLSLVPLPMNPGPSKRPDTKDPRIPRLSESHHHGLVSILIGLNTLGHLNLEKQGTPIVRHRHHRPRSPPVQTYHRAGTFTDWQRARTPRLCAQ